MDSLKTGDLILFNGSCMFSRMIEWFTGSDFSHCGIVLRNPTFINPMLRGLYLWESSWNGEKDSEDGKVKFGIQITPLKEAIQKYNGSVYYRSIDYPMNETFLKKVHNLVHNHGYDINPIDWIESLIQKDFNPQKSGSMFCSTFVSLVYSKCGVLAENTDWNLVRPNDLAKDENVTLVEPYSFGAIQRLK